MKLKLPIKLVGLVALIAAGVTPLTLAGPGSGTAIITPSSNVAAGSSGEWSIVYTAAETHDDGTVRITIPAGWTAPQDGSNSSPGFVTVSTDEPTGSPSLSIAGQVITVAVDTLNAGNSITVVYGNDSASSSARATAATTVGSYSFLVASDPSGGSVSPLSSSPALNVIPTTPASLDIVPNDSTATAGAFVQMHVRVLDTFGNRAPVPSNRTVNLFATHGQFFDPSNHSTPITSIVISSGTNSKRVDYRGTLVAGSPHTINAFTASGSPSLGGSEFVSIVPGALSASQSTIAATSPVVADGATQSTVTVTSRDAFGNPREGDTVLIDATGSATDADPGSPTDANGEAVGAVANTIAEIVAVSATINGVTVTSGNPSVTFIAGPVSALNSQVTALPSSVVANGAATSTITVSARDANNNPVAGATVVLAVTPLGNVTLTQPGGVTGPTGTITGTIASTAIGSRTVTATINGTPVTDDAVVQFTAGPIASFQWTVDGASTAGAFENVTLRVRDAQGNTVTNYIGLVSLSTTTGGSGDGVVQWDAVTPDADGTMTNQSEDDATYQFVASDNGVATLRVTNTRAETFQVRAVDGGISQLSGNLVNGSAAADKIQIVSGNGQSATVNANVSSAPTVLVLDQFDNTVSGAPVTFTALTPNGFADAISGGGLDSTVTTAGNGQIDCDVWRMSTTAGLNRLRARIPSGSTPAVFFTATGTAGPGVNLDIAPNSQSVTQGTSLVVSATLTDNFGNAKSGERVDVVIKTGTGTLSEDTGDPGTTTALNAQARWGNTDANGRITVLYNAPGGAGLSDVLDASTSSIGQGSVADATYTTVASGATNLRITFVGPSTKPANQTFQFLVEAVDGNGNPDTGNNSTVTLTPELGSTVVFSLTDFGTTTTTAQLQNGARTIYGRGTLAGDWDITVTGGGLGSDTDVVTITDTGTIDHYFVSSPTPVIAGAAFNVTVEARDLYNNRVVGANNSVTLQAYDDVANNPAQSTLLVPSGNLVNGSFVVAEQYTKAEAIRVRASAGGREGFSNVVTVNAAPAHRIAKISGDGSGIIAGATRSLVAQVVDQYDNPVTGQMVTFTMLTGGGSPAPPTDVTDSNGEASTVFTTGTTVGSNTVKATIGDENPVGLERVDYLITTVPGPVASFQVVPASLTLTAGTSVGLTVTGRDANANVVTNDDTTPIQLTETGNATFGAATGTLTDGVFNTTVSDNVAETFTITAQRQGGGASGTSALITVTHAGAYQVTKVTVDPINGVPVGANQALEVLVRDQYNNPVPTALVTFATTGVINDGSFTDGTGDPNDGIVATQTNGHATVTFTTSLTVGANNVNATILDGTPPAQERVTFVVNTVAGGIAYYTVQMSATTATAGQNRNVTISAFDASDNPVDDDVTQVDLLEDLGTGLIFGADPVTLSNGVAVTTVRSNLAQDYRVRAQTLGNAAINGVGQIVTVSPGLPALTITGTAVPPTITANGVSTSSITSSVITDAFGNKVPAGTQITVSTNRGTIVPAGTKLVNSDGQIEFDLRSSTSPGIATVTMTSVQGSATGTVNVTFAAPSAFSAPNPPTPSVVAPGDNQAFTILVQNTSNTDANLNTATTFTFSDGVRTYSANLASATSIPGPGSQTLAFVASTVDPAFTPGALTPSVVLAGTDEFGAPISTTVFGPAGSVLVTSIQIMSITAPGVVSRGQSPTVTVSVKNNGTQSTTINDIDLVFAPGGGLFNPSPISPTPVAAGATTQFNIIVAVDPSCPTGTYAIDAVATGDVGGKTVTDNSIAPFTPPTWQIVAAANLSYVAGTMTPMTVTRGDGYQFRATISNGGAGVVSLDSSMTYIRFTDGTRVYQAKPTQPYAIAGMAQQQIVFKTRAVANAFTPGSYGATFNLQGLESGAPFQQTVTSGGDQVTVQTPAAVTSGTVAPTQVSKGATVAFTVQVTNSGQSTVVLTPASTEFRFAGGAFTADLDATSQTTIPPGLSTLTFLPTTVSQAIAANTYPGQLVLVGTENGGAFSQTLNNTGSIVVENAPDIQILATTPSQTPITADQTKPFKVRMVVRNNGGAAVTFTEASLRFIQAGADRSGQYVMSTPTGFVLGGSTLNGGGATDTVTFNISDNIANAMTAPAMITIQGFLEVEDVNTQQPIFAERELGEFLQVQTPASIATLAVLPTQSTVTQNMAKDFIVRAVVQNTGTSDVNLNLTEPATDATFSPSAGWAADPRSALGHGGITLSGGEVDTVIFDVTQVGTTTGTTQISTNYSGVELNSGRPVPGSSSGSASVLVQSEGTVTVASVVSSRSTLTSGASVPYTLTVTLQNTGQSNVNLALPGAIAVAFPGASPAPGYTVPSILASGGTLLSGGETDQIVISVNGTGTYSTMGTKAINVAASGVELNSGAARNGNGGTNVTVQRAPVLNVVDVSPPIVSRGSIVGFSVIVVNTPADAATATLDRFTTRLRFGSNNFNVNLLPASPVDIDGGQQATLLFTPATIVPAIPLGNQADAVVEFRWTENGRTGSENEGISGQISVQSAPALNIVSVQASRQNITVQQTAPAWHITMMLTNSNGADVDLDLSGATTYLRLNLLGGGANVTSEYTITQPTALFGGGVRLSSGETDSLIFDVTQAGTTPGNVIVSGFVGGTDVTSQLPVSDNTGDGGSGSFVLQSAGVLNILSMTPEQSTATAGQTGPAAEYTIKLAVRNDGQAAIDLDLSAPTSTAVTFSAPTGWARNLAPTLVGGGTVLSGGETDTVVFNVTTTGTTPGVQTISGNIVGFELNTGASRSDNTASGGTGTITVQTPAVLDIVSATPSRATLTSGAPTPWDVTVVVENTGQSAARLVLPSGLLVTVQTAASSFDPVNFMQEGGVVLAGGATGTLLVHGDTSPIFSQFGTRNIGVSLDAVELNSNRAFNRNESVVGTVVGQTPPAFQIISVDPNLVTVGGQAFLRVQVRNNGANAATATLDHGETRVTFGGGVYSAFMQPVSPNVIAANQTVPLDFENKLVSNALTPGTYDLDVDLSFRANDLDDTELLVAADSITVQNAPQFQILAITTSQPSVTAGQTAQWTATMEIENSGPADIDINMTVAETYLKFIRPNGQFDNGYTVVQPTQLQGGGARLEQGSTDQLVFTIIQTGNSTGVIVISGRVGGTDIVQSLPVSDDTFDGGRGSISVVSGAAVSVAATHTSQPRVTAGQTQDWDVRVVVANTGGAAVNLDLAASNIAFNGGTGWVVTTPPTFLGAGNPLVGGGVDSLVFHVTTTSPDAGTRRIDATIPWQDVNTQATGTATTTTSGFGSIVVQIPVAIQITTTTSLSPYPQAVNVGQAFDVRVQVQNTGQADARDVVLNLAKTGASIVDPIPPITEVPGGQTVSLDIGVVAANAPEATATFTSSITSVTDENSGQPVTPQPPGDNTAQIAIQNPAVFDITNVRPSQSTVTRSQTTPWSVTVRVQNTGGSSAVLNAPAANDLAFAIGGSNKVDYVVQPPTAFASGLPVGWTLGGGLIDSLVYNVSVTGADTGLVDITPTLDGSDRNDPTITFSDTGAGSVRVQLPAGVAIVTTIPVGTVNHGTADRDTVNTGQQYEIHVTVNNSGEAVDSVLVQLTKDGGSTVAPKSLKRQQIGVDGSHTFEFRITSPASPDALETFRADILSGVRSHNTGQPVTPQPPIDRLHQVVIQRPANLAINLSSVSGAVSPNQLFQMSAVVTNSGQAGVTGTAEVTLVVPPGFSQENPGTEPLTRTFTIGTPVTWLMRAPSSPTTGNFTSSISTVPLDRNTNAAAAVSQGTDAFAINVTTGGGLSAPQIQIATPAGARDHILSDSQNFAIVDSVYATDDTDNVVATITVPAGFSVVGNSTRNLGDGNNTLIGSVNPFNIIAPSTTGTSEIYVTFTGVDANTQQPIPSVADTITVTIIPRAALTTSAAVTAPPEATDNTVSVGTTFTVSARVDNALNAAGIASPGILRISLPNGYVLNGAEVADKPFTIATPVTWQVDAPQQPSGPQQINVTINTVPPDENSGQPANLLDPNAAIAMVTEGSAVAVRDVSTNLGIDVGPVPAGTDDIRMLGFEIAYNVSDPSVADARIDSIAVTIIGPDGSPLGPGTVGNTLDKLSIDIGGPAPVDVFDPSSNPVVVSFMSGGGERMIAPDATRNAIVSISLYPNPSAKEFSVGLRSGGVCVRDDDSNQRLGVTDSNGQPLDGNITSEPLIVLSSNFEEYVHNYPNPFRAGAQDTRIAYVMDQAGSVSVRIYAIDGSLVYEENIPAGDARAQAGPQETTWDGRNGKGEVVRNGVYVCVLNAGGRSAKFRIAVAK